MDCPAQSSRHHSDDALVVCRAESRNELPVENVALIEIVDHRRILSVLRTPEADVAIVIADRVTRYDNLGSLRDLIRVVASHFKILALPDLFTSDVFERAYQKVTVLEYDFVEGHVIINEKNTQDIALITTQVDEAYLQDTYWLNSMRRSGALFSVSQSS